MKHLQRGRPLMFALAYGVVAALWITSSDYLVLMLTDARNVELSWIQLLEGLLFVAITTLALFYLLRAEQRQKVGIHAAYQSLLHTPTQFLWLADNHGKSYHVSEGLEAITGVSVDSLTTLSWRKLLHPDDRERYHALRKAAINDAQPYKTQVRFRSHNGTYRTMESQERPLYSARGKLIGWIGLATDVTVFEDIEDQLKFELRNLQLAQDIANVSLWEWDIAKLEPRFSRHLQEQLGYTVGELPETLDTFVELIHPDDRQRLWQEIGRITEGNTPEQENRFRLQHKDGNYRWMLSRVRGEENDKGRVIRLIGATIDITTLKQAEEQQEFLANHDPATGLYNALYFKSALAEQKLQSRQNNENFGLLLISVDNGRALEITTGETSHTLTLLTAVLQRHFTEPHILCRIDACQFAVIYLTMHTRQTLTAAAEALLGAFRKPEVDEEQLAHYTVVIGSSLYPNDGDDILSHALEALRLAHWSNDSNHTAYSKNVHERVQHWQQAQGALQNAVAHRQLTLHWSLRTQLGSGAVKALRALPLWSHKLQKISYEELVELAESTGLLYRLDAMLVDMALQQGPPLMTNGLILSVPVSPQSLLNERFLPELLGKLRSNQLPPERFEVCVPEQLIGSNSHRVWGVLRQLARYGIRVQISRYGIGNSEFNSLRKLHTSGLEIDPRFTQDCDTNALHELVVDTICAIGRNLELELTACEPLSACQKDALARLGCQNILSEPLSSDDLQNRLQPAS